MAGLMRKGCRACGKDHPINAIRCTCGARLTSALPIVVEIAQPPEPVAPDNPAPVGRWKCAFCQFAQNDEQETVCRLCERERAPTGVSAVSGAPVVGATYLMRFPFGDMIVPRELAVGRDPAFCSFADNLLAFDKVSRRHAIVKIGAGFEISIVDLGSTNGTFVNGNRLAAHSASPLYVEDEVSFSKSLTCRIARGD